MSRTPFPHHAPTLSLLLALFFGVPSAFADIPEPKAHVDPGFAKYSAENGEATLIQLSEHAYAAVGYDIGNIGFIVTDEGILVFDTGGEVERATEALKAIREVSDAPIIGVVYSHGHGDHTGGVDAFIKKAQRGKIPIYAGKNFRRYLRESAVPRGLMRAYYQMGTASEGQNGKRWLGNRARRRGWRHELSNADRRSGRRTRAEYWRCSRRTLSFAE